MLEELFIKTSAYSKALTFVKDLLASVGKNLDLSTAFDYLPVLLRIDLSLTSVVRSHGIVWRELQCAGLR